MCTGVVLTTVAEKEWTVAAWPSTDASLGRTTYVYNIARSKEVLSHQRNQSVDV